MKTSQIVFLGIAVIAAGGAFILRGVRRPAPQIVHVAAQAPQIKTDNVLVATHDIPIGTVISPADISWKVWPVDSIGPGMMRQSRSAKAMQDVEGSFVRRAFVQGEPILLEKLVKAGSTSFMSAILPSGFRAVAINIDTQGSTTAGGFILPDDRVDVIHTYRDDSAPKGTTGDRMTSETILQNVKVLAIGQNIQEKNGQRVVVGSNATLEVDPHQAEILVLAQRTGQLTLALRSLLDSTGPADTTAQKDDQDMSVVRYGVESRLARK